MLEENVAPQAGILLVDDHPANLVALEAVLGPLGERLVKAGSGEEALRCLLSEDFSLILLDVQMPGLDGFETAQLIKARERTRHIPLLFLTAIHRDEQYMLRGYTLGAVDYMVKPFPPEVLRAKVKSLLEMHRQGQAHWRSEAVPPQPAEEATARGTQAEAVRGREWEQTRAQKSEVMRLITEQAPSALFVVDEQGHASFMNPAAERMTGWSLEELQGRTLHDVLHSRREDGTALPRCECVILQSLERGEPLKEHSDVFLRRDGSFFPVRCALGMLERGGRRVGAVLEVQDVTERGRSEQAAVFLAKAGEAMASSLEEEELLERVVKLSVPWLADWCAVDLREEEGPLRRVVVEHREPAKAALVEELARRYPIRETDAVGVGWVVRTGEPVWSSEMPEALRDRVARDAGQLELLRQLAICSYIIVPLKAWGRTLGALTLCMAESRRRYTAADVPLAMDLARRVGQAVDNAQLFRQAQEAIRVRDEFLSVASHELKTPLTPLSLRLQGLLREVASRPESLQEQRVVASVEAARRQVKRLSDLVNGLLDVTRITTGRLTLELERVDLAALVREVASRFREEAERAKCELEVRAEGPVEGRWDRMRLEQVVTSLLSNALKYGAGRPVRVEVVAEGGVARLVVRDEGIGIAPEHLSRIFGRFERAVSDRHYGGLGLGLYFCQQIAEALGGRVVAQSEPGAGATFTVEVPCEGPGAPEE
ncbi:ATP-binding protein [Hyalangium rubrum]|uniref:histidine kinase n=1 Tax=Hyalangium rubrum TaxID=3103134 RepID=A0ABU5HET4_9BACT|nr:ATP-binding protein [Hyalangium sp. s54d21]MDY7231389.1 response regulator [Hyalangium sp. s54d21]